MLFDGGLYDACATKLKSASCSARGVTMTLQRLTGTSALLIFLATPGVPAAAPVTTSAIEGVVIDSSGAILPGVTVEIRSADTNLTRTMITDNGGRFAALQIAPGKYVVTLKLPGFATVVLDNVVATIGDTIRLNPTMKVSGVAE